MNRTARYDVATILAMTLLSIMGLSLLSFYEPSFFYRQCAWMAVAGLMFVAVLHLEPLHVLRLCQFLLLLTLCLMVAVLFMGDINGAKRWLTFAGLSIQPVEFFKPAFAVVSAWLLLRLREEGQPIYALSSFLLLSISVTLLLLQPDVGQSLMVLFLWGAQLFLVGAPITGYMTFVMGIILGGAYVIYPHVARRMAGFFIHDPYGASFQKDRALDAMSASGWLGAEHHIIHLPDRHNDFIFALAIQEWGALASLMIVGALLFIFYRQLMLSWQKDSMFHLLAVGSLMMIFILPALIHIASNGGFIPPKGIALPFVSYGGSALLGASLTLAFCLALNRKEAR